MLSQKPETRQVAIFAKAGPGVLFWCMLPAVSLEMMVCSAMLLLKLPCCRCRIASEYVAARQAEHAAQCLFASSYAVAQSMPCPMLQSIIVSLYIVCNHLQHTAQPIWFTGLCICMLQDMCSTNAIQWSLDIRTLDIRSIFLGGQCNWEKITAVWLQWYPEEG